MAMSELETMGGSPNPKLQQIQNNYVAAIATVDQIAAALGLTQNKDLGAILEAIADLKDKATKAVECTQIGIEVLKEKVELINAIATELKLNGDFEDADVLRQVKAERQVKECAMLAARERSEALDAIATELNINEYEYDDLIDRVKTERWIKEQAVADAKNRGASLDAIAEQLGIKFTGNTDDIYEAIILLKAERKALDAIILLKAERKALDAIAGYLGFDSFNGELIPIYEAIKELQVWGDSTSKQFWIALAESLGLDANRLAKADILCAIANLKHSLELSQNEVKQLGAIIDRLRFPGNFKLENVLEEITLLRGKAETLDKLQSDLTNTDFGELQSERDYYRGILDKLCDRLKVVDIEALEHAVKHQEMSIDFTLQHNDDLQEKFIAAKVMASKRLSRIVELENELRSLKEPVNTVARSDRHEYKIKFLENGEIVRAKFDEPFSDEVQGISSDRLTTLELIQIIRNLLK